MEARGVKPMSFEEQMTMKVKHGMSFFSQREAFLKAAEEGKQLEYIDEEEEDKFGDSSPSKSRGGTMQPTSSWDQPNKEKLIHIKSEPFKVVPKDSDLSKTTIPINRRADEEEDKDQISKKEYRVNGFKIPKPEIYERDNLGCIVNDPTWHNEGFFIPNYVTYQLQTPDLGFNVRRKDKDFAVLQEYLNKMYPHILVPWLPELKKAEFNDTAYWEKRAASCQTFMNHVLRCQELRSCPILMDFLKVADFKAYSKQLKASIDKANKPNGTNDLYWTTGFHVIDSNKRMLEFGDKLAVYLNVYETNWGKYHTLTRKLADQLFEVSKTCDELGLWARQFSKVYKLSDDMNFSKLYEDIEIMFNRWSNVQKDTASIVAKNLALFHSFPMEHLQSLKNLEAAKMQHQATYEKAAYALDKKKERAFKSRDLSKWEMKASDMARSKELIDNKKEAYKAMFFVETDQLRQLRDTYRYFINQTYREIRRTNRYDMIDTHVNYIKMWDRIKNTLYEDLQIWTDFEMKYKEETFPPERDDIYHIEEVPQNKLLI